MLQVLPDLIKKKSTHNRVEYFYLSYAFVDLGQGITCPSSLKNGNQHQMHVIQTLIMSLGRKKGTIASSISILNF